MHLGVRRLEALNLELEIGGRAGRRIAPSVAVLVAWNAPWSRCVVTPTSRAWFIASITLRRRSAGLSNVWRRKSSAFEHSLMGNPPATEPSAPTFTPLARRMLAPALFA